MSTTPRPSLSLSLVLAGAVLACTAVIAEDPVQCTNDADCSARGPDFADTVCGPEGLCAPRPSPAPECTKSSECAARGANQVCSAIQRRCVQVTSDECSVAYGDPLADGAVLFGLLGEISPEDTLYYREQQHLGGAKLAFAEFFDRAAARFPGGRGAALIACSERSPRKASAHLANIGVRAVIGPSHERRQKAVVETLLGARVPSFSPWIGGNPAAVVPEAAGFAWLTSFSRTDLVAPLNALVAEHEARVRQGSGSSARHLRVAVIVNEQATSGSNPFAEYGTLMDQRLTFNGKSAVENERDSACGNCYRRFATGPGPSATVDQRANEIVAFNPHVVIPFVDLDWGLQLLPKLEERYALATVSINRPLYVHPFLQFEDDGYKSLPVSSASLRRRITGVRPLRNNTFEIFQNRFRETFRPPSSPTELGPSPSFAAGRAFETAILLLLATHAALVNDPDARPEDVVAALALVTDSTSSTKVTASDLARAVERLNARERIDLDGLLSSFDLDPSAFSATGRWTTWCVDAAGQYVSRRPFVNNTFGAPATCD